MAVHGDSGLTDVRDVLLDQTDEVAELLGDGVADGVRDVDGRRAGVDALGEHAVDVIEVGAGGVHRRELDVGAVPGGAGDHGAGHLQHGLLVLLELVHDVDVRAGEEDVDARPGGVLDRIPAGVDVSRHRPCQPGDDGTAHLLRDSGDGFEVAGGRSRKAGLDEVDTQPLQGLGDLQLLLDVEGDAGGLLAVAQGGIEDQYLIICHCSQPPFGRAGLKPAPTFVLAGASRRPTRAQQAAPLRFRRPSLPVSGRRAG